MHLQAFLDYQPPSRRYRGRALLLACTAGVDPGQAEAWARLVPDLTVRDVDADHFNVLTAPNLSTVVARIDEFLAAKAG